MSNLMSNIAGRIKDAKTATPQGAYEFALSQRAKLRDEFVRDLEIETTVLKDWRFANLYAKHVLEDRWPEFERVVERSVTSGDLNDQLAVFSYSVGVMNQDIDQPSERRRWVDGERHLYSNPDLAVRYARDVIGGRWEPDTIAEETILRDPEASREYAKIETPAPYSY